MSKSKPPIEPKKPRAGNTAARDPQFNDENWREKAIRRNRIKFDDEKKAIFLEALTRTGAKLLSCEAADITATTVNEHLKNDLEFAAAYDEALAIRAESMVEQIETEALEGHIEVRYDKDTGNKIYEKKHVETPIRAMILKKNNDGYKDKQDINLTGNNNGGVLVVPAGVSMEEFLKEAAVQREKMLKDQAELADQAAK